MRRGVFVCSLMSVLVAACLSQTAQAQWKGGLIGGGMGAGIGAIAGGGKGALIGGLVGGSVGALTEHSRKQSKKTKRQRQADEAALAQQHREQQRALAAQQAEIRRLQDQQRQQADQQSLAAIQGELVTLGYAPDNTNGAYTVATQQAIEQYQYNSHLPVNGLASDELLRHLQISRQQAQDAVFRQQVASIQGNLNTLGYGPGPANGAYTTQTRDAIARYQFDHGLLADGAPSAAISGHIQETVSDTAGRYKPGADAPTVRELVQEIQVNLAALEYDPGEIDGLFGPKTSVAIMAYQSNQALTTNGLASLSLLQHLERTRATADGLAVPQG